MANSDYSWNDILNGYGTLSINGGIAYSSGVYTLQTYLNNIGYSITADGQFGNNTKKPCEFWQRLNKCKIDEINGCIDKKDIDYSLAKVNT